MNNDNGVYVSNFSNISDDNKSGTPEKKRMWLPFMIVVIIFCAFCAVWAYSSITKASARLDRATANLEAQQTKAEDAADELVSRWSGAVSKSSDGIDMSRVARERKQTAEATSMMFTWSDYTTYDAARNKLIETYKVDSTSQLLSQFMPASVTSVDVDGHGSINSIDATGMSMSCSDVEVYLEKADGEDYTYIAVADVTGTKVSADASTTGHAVVEWTTHADGTVTAGAWSTGIDV